MSGAEVSVGDRLPNGSVVLAIRETVKGSRLVLAWFLRDNCYATWKLDIAGHTYGGHYFNPGSGDTTRALQDAVADYARRM